MPGMLRAFVAVEMPGPVRQALEEVQSSLEQLKIRARWVRPENIHLTLKFLGNIPAGHVPSVVDVLRIVAPTHGRFNLAAAGLGVFPDIRRPKVIWVGLTSRPDALTPLQQDLDGRLALLGFPREEKPFRGHLTIGRFRAEGHPGPVADAVKRYAATTFGTVAVEEIVLLQSDLRPEGPRYTPLAREKLMAS
jgi:RNA 2',3'-cyclic 3'-phosphodiesterase